MHPQCTGVTLPVHSPQGPSHDVDPHPFEHPRPIARRAPDSLPDASPNATDVPVLRSIAQECCGFPPRSSTPRTAGAPTPAASKLSAIRAVTCGNAFDNGLQLAQETVRGDSKRVISRIGGGFSFGLVAEWASPGKPPLTCGNA